MNEIAIFFYGAIFGLLVYHFLIEREYLEKEDILENKWISCERIDIENSVLDKYKVVVEIGGEERVFVTENGHGFDDLKTGKNIKLYDKGHDWLENEFKKRITFPKEYGIDHER